MAKFMAIHSFPKPVPVSQAEPVAKATKALSNADVYWLGSTVQLDDAGNVSRIICEYDAKDIGSVIKLLEQLGKQFPGFPVEGPYPMMKVDGESYR